MANLNKIYHSEILIQNSFRFPGVHSESVYTLLITNNHRPLHLNIQDSIVYSYLLHTSVYIHNKRTGILCLEKLELKENLLSILNKWKREAAEQNSDLQISSMCWDSEEYEFRKDVRIDCVVNECFSRHKLAKCYEKLGQNENKLKNEYICKVTWKKNSRVLKLETDAKEMQLPKKVNMTEQNILAHSSSCLYRRQHRKIQPELDKYRLKKLSDVSSYLVERVKEGLRNVFGLNLIKIEICMRLNEGWEWEFRYFDCILASKPKISIVLLMPVFDRPCLRRNNQRQSKHRNIIEEVRKLKETMKEVLEQSQMKIHRQKIDKSLSFSIKKTKQKNKLKAQIHTHHRSSGEVDRIAKMELNRTVDLLNSYLSHN